MAEFTDYTTFLQAVKNYRDLNLSSWTLEQSSERLDRIEEYADYCQDGSTIGELLDDQYKFLQWQYDLPEGLYNQIEQEIFNRMNYYENNGLYDRVFCDIDHDQIFEVANSKK